jgi:hypothetical protein
MAQRKRQPPLELSDDAKAVLGSIFQNGCALTFQMIESRPTQRMDEALRELVEAQVIVKERGFKRADGSHAITYRSRIPTEGYRRFASKGEGLQIVEPIT